MWKEVELKDVYDKLEQGVNLAVVVFNNNSRYNMDVAMSNKVEAGKIYNLMQEPEAVKFFEFVEEETE